MKNRKEENGSFNDNWETPEYILEFVRKYFKGENFFDPCPLSIDIGGGNFQIQFNGLNIDWQERNFVNPPYNRHDKPKFIKKAYEEYLKGNTSILLIPATTEVKWFHQYIIPYAQIFFIEGRVKFKGFNSKGNYVTNKSGQTGSMICILNPNEKPSINTLKIDHNI
ncbi:MAG TPA: DNA N-6-adenine-methyltransferase [Candidatus Absconditabacterales bacterium]|nr:DNA N-6-adenine-methyltransferase [Candidatus Absconditabacterales bacterium]